MKLDCICGTFNRAFDTGAMDQVRFVARCASDLRFEGVEHQDIHFPQTRPPISRCSARQVNNLSLTIIGIGVHNDYGRADAIMRQCEVVKVRR